MKKLLLILTTLAIAMSTATGCFAAEQPTESGKTLVVYYSATGSTEKVANHIAAAASAEIFEIEPTQPYTDNDLDWTDENSRVSREHDNENERNVKLVSTTVPNWEDYDIVFVGYPIWWGIASWVVDSFWDDASKTATLTYNGDEIKLTINSQTAYLNNEPQTLDVTPVIINDRTMLPIRFIAESFGFDVDWAQDTQTVTITDAGGQD